MAEYLIELPHTKAECINAGSEIKDSELLPMIYWGYGSDLHNGWAIVEAENESAVWSLIDSDVLRNKARIVQVGKWTKENIESYIKSTQA